jgi:hypothetical protein
VGDTKYGSLRGGYCSKEVAGPFGVSVETYKGGGGKFFLNLLGLRWEMDSMCDFGMIYGVGNKP